MNIEEQLRILDETCPLIPYTGSSCLFSTVRRMKAEKEMAIPIEYRTGFAICVKTGKRANEMTPRQWENFYKRLCDNLKRRYPELHERLFP
jgi:CRISPR/Cas system endoribonuclease Cas6 (RAMP superfamily)